MLVALHSQLIPEKWTLGRLFGIDFHLKVALTLQGPQIANRRNMSSFVWS